jgi:rhodanese-related sulfurtransferase
MRTSEKRGRILFLMIAAMGVGMMFVGGSVKAAGGGQTFVLVSPSEAFDLIGKNEGNPGFVLLDVRTPQEYAKGHLRDAVLIDYRSKTFEQEIGRLDRGKTYLLYCRTGNRSDKAMDLMRTLGFGRVYHLAGGIEKWKEDSRPIVR